MKLTEEQIRGMVDLRESLRERTAKLHEELETIQLSITALDVALKQSSFTKASQYVPDREEPAAKSAKSRPEKKPAPVEPAEPTEPAGQPRPDPKPITVGDGETVGNIYVYPDRISILLEPHIKVSQETPPFRTFFVSRILGEMQKKDAADVESGSLEADSAITFQVSTEGDHIREISISNYRLEERAREIASTAKWVLSRMLEHAG